MVSHSPRFSLFVVVVVFLPQNMSTLKERKGEEDYLAAFKKYFFQKREGWY
jgi:hypothetical protein